MIAAPGVSPVGAAYVYHLSGTTWSQQQELTEPGGGEFAWAVAMSGSELLVGMPIGGQPDCGTAFAYKLSGTQFTMQQPIADPDESCTSSDKFGYSVALTSTFGVFGAPGATNAQEPTTNCRFPDAGNMPGKLVALSQSVLRVQGHSISGDDFPVIY